MKKNILFLFLFLFFTNFALAEIKIGFVKVDQLLKEAPQASDSNKKLENEFKGRTEKLKKEISALNDQEKAFQKDALILSEKDKEKKQKKFQQLRIDIQRAERELREDIDLRRREEINKLQNQVTKVIEKIAVDEKFDLILYTGVAYAGDKVDITKKVLSHLGELK